MEWFLFFHVKILIFLMIFYLILNRQIIYIFMHFIIMQDIIIFY